MPKVAFATIILFLMLPRGVISQDCDLSGKSIWSEQLRHIIDGCAVVFVSPDGALTARIDTDGRLTLIGISSEMKTKFRPRPIKPPAMFSWSPKSDAFFVNDGEGSGMSSVFRLFRINTQIVEDRMIEARVATQYRARKRCNSDAANPNVWGIGWSADGTSIYLLVQSTVNAPCGESGSFESMVVKKSDGLILEHLSEAETVNRFRALVPPELSSK